MMVNRSSVVCDGGVLIIMSSSVSSATWKEVFSLTAESPEEDGAFDSKVTRIIQVSCNIRRWKNPFGIQPYFVNTKKILSSILSQISASMNLNPFFCENFFPH